MARQPEWLIRQRTTIKAKTFPVLSLGRHGAMLQTVARAGIIISDSQENSLSDAVRMIFVGHHIRQLFQAVVTSEMVKHLKPAPDVFLETAHRIGVAPEHCRACEDTEIGRRAIRDAGMEAVDVRKLHLKSETRIGFRRSLLGSL